MFNANFNTAYHKHTPKIQLHRLSPILLTKFPCNHTHRPYSVIKSIIAFVMRYIRCDHKNRNVNHFGSVEMPHLQPKHTAHAFLRIYWILARSFRISWHYFVLIYFWCIWLVFMVFYRYFRLHVCFDSEFWTPHICVYTLACSDDKCE